MERRILRQLAAKNPEDGGLIRRRMQDLNALAAASPKSGGGVSQDCGVISFRFDGYGVLQLGDASGIGPGQIPMISNGVNTARFMAEAMSKLGIDMSRMRMTNATLVSTNNPGPASSLRAPCTFPIAETDSSGGYEIHEITGDDFEPLVAEDVNDVDHVVGTGRGEQAVPWTTQIPWLGWDGHASKLDYDGSAWAISVNNQIAALVTEGTGEKAARYAEGRIEVLSLYDGERDIFVGTNSSVKAINSVGTIAGYVRTHTGVPGENNMRAAIFQPSQSPTVLAEVTADQGVLAVDINDRNQILVMVNLGFSGTRSVLWVPESGSWAYVGGLDTNVTPISLTNEGVILGRASGMSLALICGPDGEWRSLGTGSGWEPVDMNDAGDVVGFVTEDRVLRPWLRRSTGEMLLLPYIIGHDTNPKAINNVGTIVGTAQADHGGHAVIWRRG